MIENFITFENVHLKKHIFRYFLKCLFVLGAYTVCLKSTWRIFQGTKKYVKILKNSNTFRSDYGPHKAF